MVWNCEAFFWVQPQQLTTKGPLPSFIELPQETIYSLTPPAFSISVRIAKKTQFLSFVFSYYYKSDFFRGRRLASAIVSQYDETKELEKL
jgi:hypothetical protein